MGRPYSYILAARLQNLEFDALCCEVGDELFPYIGNVFISGKKEGTELLALLGEAQGVHKLFGDTAEKYGKTSEGLSCVSFTLNESFLAAYGRSLKLSGEMQANIQKHLKQMKSAAEQACEDDEIRQALLVIKELRGDYGQLLAQVFKKGVSWECDESTPEIKRWNKELKRLLIEAGFEIEISHGGTYFKVSKPKGEFRKRYYDLIELEDKYILYELLNKHVLSRQQDVTPPGP